MAGLEVRQDLVGELRGQTVHVPDLHDILPDWPHAINPEIERLRRDVEARLDRSPIPKNRLLRVMLTAYD